MGDFVFDDRFLIVDTMNQLSLQDIWLSGLWEDNTEQANFYRPLFSTTLLFDQWAFGTKATGYHIHSLIWHCLNILLFYRLSTLLLKPNKAIVASVVFSFHPILSEVVFWISARNDTMAMSFVLGFLCVLLGIVQRGLKDNHKMLFVDNKHVVGLLGLFVAGMLSKESTLILFVPVVLMSLRYRTLIPVLIGMVLFTVVIFYWRYRIGIESPSMSLSSTNNVLNAVGPILLDGFGRLLFPWRLSPATPVAWLSVTWWQSLLALVTFGVLLHYVYKTKEPMWLLWIVCSVALSIPAIVYTGNIGDRYWAISIIGWSVILARVVPIKWAWIPIPFWMVAIFLRGSAWTSDLNFWSQEYRLNPTPYTAVSLAFIHFNEQQFDKAMQGFYEGFSGSPPHLDGCTEFVSSVLSVEGPESAFKASQWSIDRGCAEDGEMFGLQSVILVGLKQWDEAEQIASKPIVDPTKRLDVVRMLFDWRNGRKSKFCKSIVEWSDVARVFQQLQILSKEDYQTMQQAPCFPKHSN